MRYEAIESLYLSVPDLEAASAAYGGIGLPLTPVSPGQALLHVGEVAIRFLSGEAQDALLIASAQAALQSGRTLFALGMRVNDLSQTLSELSAHGVQVNLSTNAKGDAAWLPLHDDAGADLLLFEKLAVHETPKRNEGTTFPLKRLDHLAIVTHGLEEKTRYWTEVLGIPVVGEVKTPTLVIRQLRIGDAIVELLGAAFSDSPLHQRPAGLVSMASWEVTNMQAAVQQARNAGYTVPDPAPGPLPGTRITTIPGTELAGMNMQLLEYV